MDSQIVNQFIKATTSIFFQVNNVSLTKSDLEYFPDGHRVAARVATILGVTGAFKGQFIILIDEAMAMKIASASMGGVPVPTYGKLAESAVCELGNMIGGEASKRLLESGYDCDITSPRIVRGEEIVITSASFVSKFASEWGELQLIVKFDNRAQIK
ncbi:MAG: hypothetical protein A2W80_17010 [Candidatus Riflebacteria bacterium GWC2_50_8]|nr:MAG: hypothetical protein A2W80_17010 [Candidatus Riflebacteria bacterium GWC2_50_8]